MTSQAFRVCLGSRDRAQFKDYAKFMRPLEEMPVVAGQEIAGVKYVFTSPRGARANLKWIIKQMDEYGKKLAIELFNEQGVKSLFHGKEHFDGIRR